MKPIGPLPPEFADQSGALQIGGRAFSEYVEQAGDTPLFLYDFSIVADRVARLREAVPSGVDVHYAVKANPFPPLLDAIAPLVDGLDVASAGELDRALAVKPAASISFAGPGKRDRELAAAIDAGATINLESEAEADRALAIADRAGATPRLAIRINPDFELRGGGMKMGGRASQFGIGQDRAVPLARRLIHVGADWRGWHVFAGSQSLDTAAIIAAQAATIALVRRLSDDLGVMPPLANIGGGFGIPYFAGDTPIDVAAIGAALQEARATLPDVRLALELGRWLVGEAGVYLTRIVDRKESRGEVFLVTDGGLHHQLAATGNLGAVVRRNFPIAIAHAMGALPVETANVVGCLCTPLDRLAEQVALPRAEIGDVVAIFVAGAYGLTASPIEFLGHPRPREVLIRDGQATHSPNAIFTC